METIDIDKIKKELITFEEKANKFREIERILQQHTNDITYKKTCFWCRLEYLKQLLCNQDHSKTNICYKCGYERYEPKLCYNPYNETHSGHRSIKTVNKLMKTDELFIAMADLENMFEKWLIIEKTLKIKE